MTRKGIIAAGVVVAAWVGIGVLLGTGTLSAGGILIGPGGKSPACLPTFLDHNSQLSGTNATVSPAPNTHTASPYTQISFLGVPAFDVQNVAVTGSKSGYHHGRLQGYYQGDGASFIANTAFTPDEWVTVRASVGPSGGARQVYWGFRIAAPYPTNIIPSFPNPSISNSAVQTFVSDGSLKAPLLHVDSVDRDPGAGDIFMTTGPGPGQYGPLLYSPSGRLLWFRRLYGGKTALDFTEQRYDGQPVLTWWQGRVLAAGFGLGEDIIMNNNYQQVATVTGGNGLQADLHELQIEPNDTAFITAYNVIRCDLSSVGGARNGTIIDSAVQEIDIKTGLVRWQWDSVDHIDTSESHSAVTSGTLPWDWFHLNSIDPLPGGDVLISSRNTWALYRLRPSTGLIQWRLGGLHSNFSIAANARFAFQHDARMLANGHITMFDDGSNPRQQYQSRGQELTLDLSQHRVTLARRYTHPSPLLADSQGDMETLASGNEVLGWGAIPAITEFARNGSVLFDAHLSPGLGSYRAFRHPWSGTPLSRPSVAARNIVTHDEVAVYASWNGASTVASWRVLAGSNGDSLAPEGSMPASDFESSVIVPGAYSQVAVQALSANGTVLATSPTVGVSGAAGT